MWEDLWFAWFCCEKKCFMFVKHYLELHVPCWQYFQCSISCCLTPLSQILMCKILTKDIPWNKPKYLKESYPAFIIKRNWTTGTIFSKSYDRKIPTDLKNFDMARMIAYFIQLKNKKNIVLNMFYISVLIKSNTSIHFLKNTVWFFKRQEHTCAVKEISSTLTDRVYVNCQGPCKILKFSHIMH